jgi:hypothetical protein
MIGRQSVSVFLEARTYRSTTMSSISLPQERTTGEASEGSERGFYARELAIAQWRTILLVPLLLIDYEYE